MVTNDLKLLVIPLGGFGEIGKNIMAIRYMDDIIVIDCGLMFPEDEMLGIDVVIPDISYLVENKKLVKGIILTHGHEDHIGAIPYLLDSLNVPIYGTSLTLGLLEAKLEENLVKVKAELHLVNAGQKITLGAFVVEFLQVNHSIPDSVGLVIKTPLGTIVHTGDFKIDQTPVNGDEMMIHRFAELGSQDVLLLMSDSINSEKTGFTPSERTVGSALERVFSRALEDRIIIATFASNLHRLQQIIDTSEKFNRKLLVLSHKVQSVIDTATKLNKLRLPEKIMISSEEAKSLPKKKIAVITAGSQGEPMSVLTKLAFTQHKQLEISTGDTVIISASTIPGNEKVISRTIDSLFKLGAKVVYDSTSAVHVSGHASQEELKIMLNLVKPKYFLPIHGEFRHLVKHKKIAEEIGLKAEQIFVMENGQVLEISKEKAVVAGRVQAGKILVDGLGIGDVGNIVLRDRRQLSQDGIFIVVVTISKESGLVVAGPDMVSRGFVYVRESEKLMEEAKEKVAHALEQCQEKHLSEWSAIKSSVREVLGKFLYEKTRRRPMIMPIIMEV
ncbi:MAG: ribonuclease J [Clostridia bacterium]|nr:ribonuclease J [Clostridia bacterium]